jgi:hypothetical protein
MGVTLSSKLMEISRQQQEEQLQFLREAMRGESRAELLIRGQSVGYGIGDVSDLLERYSIAEPTDLKCEGGNTVSRMCINSKCTHSSLHCPHESCQQCHPKHDLC